MDLISSEFTDIEFPQHKEIVYILYFMENDSVQEVPFYVGESSRGVGRFGDYISAKFSAPTDFKVGEAIRYMRNRGFNVRIKYKESDDRKSEERKIINDLQRNSRLLNELEGFNYTVSNESDERTKIHNFIDILLLEKGVRDASKVKDCPTENPTVTANTRNSSIPDLIQNICQELGKDGKIILRKDIIARAKKLGIEESSVLPADYCDNTTTGKWSRHSFLHSVGPGKYVLKNLLSGGE